MSKVQRKSQKVIVLLLIIVVQVTSLPVSVIAQELEGVNFASEPQTDGVIFSEVATSSGLLFTEENKDTGILLPNDFNPTPVIASPISDSVSELTQHRQAVLSAQTRADTIIKKLAKKHYRAEEKVVLKIEHPRSKDSIKTTLLDPDGKEANVTIEKRIQDEFMNIGLLPTNSFRPGVYKIHVENSDTGEKIVQDFTWGVLAINSNKSIYAPGEKAHFSLGVLDEKGRMVCDATVELKIKNDTLHINDTLTTENGKIIVNEECSTKDFTLIPDYEAEYEVKGSGVYIMELSASHHNGTYSITDEFEVRDNFSFDIERTTATRIYPPHNYPVSISVTAHENFEGTVIETVPESFGITQTEEGIAYDEVSIVPAGVNPASSVLGERDSLSLPFKGNRKLTAGFGDEVSDPLLAEKYEEFHLLGHDGVDFDMPSGTEVLAVADGEVVLAEEDFDYGTTMVVQHAWGKSYYGHLSKMVKQKGERVKKGDTIALSGNSGLSTDGHLHFGIKLNNNNTKNGYYGKIDPTSLLGFSEVEQVLGSRTSSEQVKQIMWNIKVKKGDTVQLSYAYQAPFQSPQFYTLGPARMFRNNDLIFSETRQWQVAVDDTANYTISDGSLTAALTSGACDTSQTNNTQTDGAQGTVIQSQCVGRSDIPVVKWTKTLTWESMGIPAGSTITQVDGSFKYRVVTESHTATQAMGTMQLRDSADTADCAASILEASFDPGAVNAAFTTRNASGVVNVSAGCQASSTSVTIRLNMSPATGNNASATSALRADDIQLSITYTPPQPNLTQIHSRWRNDDGDETNATWRRAEDVSATANAGATRRIRMEVSNEGAATATGTTYRLEYGLLSTTCSAIASWTQVLAEASTPGGTDRFEMVLSSQFTDATSTTNVASGLTDENTTFVAGQIKESTSQTAGISLTTTQFTEVEFSIASVAANVSTNQVYCFRLTNAGSTTNFTYTQYPQITIGEPNMDQNHYRWRNDDGAESAVNTSFYAHPVVDFNNVWGGNCANAWDCVNDQSSNASTGAPATHDGDTTYSEDSGSQSTTRLQVGLANDLVPTSATVTQLIITLVGRESANSGTDPQVRHFYRIGGGSSVLCSSTTTLSGTTYQTVSCTFSGLSLTSTDFNNLNIGVETANTNTDPRVTQLYVEVSYSNPGATWKQNEDTAHTGHPTGSNIRLRYEVANTGAVAANRNLLLEYAERTGGTCGDEVFTSVPVASGSPFEMVTSTYFSDGEATTALLTATGTFVAGKMVEDSSNSSGAISITNAFYTEVEYVFQPASSAAGKTYCFRVSDNGTVLDTYTRYAELSVIAGGPTLDQLMRHGKWFSNGVKQPFTF